MKDGHLEEGDMILTTLRNCIRNDREMCDAASKMCLIADGGKLLQEESSDLVSSSSSHTPSPQSSDAAPRRWLSGADGERRRLSFNEKRGLVRLIAEIIRGGGGESLQKDELLKGAMCVSEEGRRMGAAGEEGERDAEILMWEIMKKKYGTDMKNRAELQREKEEAERKKEEAEREKEEKKKKRYSLEQEKKEEKKKREEAERVREEEKQKREEAERCYAQERQKRKAVEAKLKNLEESSRSSELCMNAVLTDSSSLKWNNKTLTHTGASRAESCTFPVIMRNVSPSVSYFFITLPQRVHQLFVSLLSLSLLLLFSHSLQ